MHESKGLNLQCVCVCILLRDCKRIQAAVSSLQPIYVCVSVCVCVGLGNN